jgi:hypothetical protein
MRSNLIYGKAIFSFFSFTIIFFFIIEKFKDHFNFCNLNTPTCAWRNKNLILPTTNTLLNLHKSSL